MTIEQHVTSLELSKRLKELGVKQKSLFYWYEVEPNENFIAYHKDKPSEILVRNPVPWEEQPKYLKCSHIWKRYRKESFTSAFLSSELGEMLPGTTIVWKSIEDNLWTCSYREYPVAYAISEADARAECLIWLIENKYIDVEQFGKNEQLISY